MRWLPLAVLLVVAVTAWLAWLRRAHLVVTVRGPSMVPTYQHGDRLLARRRAGRRVRVGQVVVVDLPERLRPIPEWVTPEESLANRRVIKRVAAVAGDPVPFRIDDSPVVPPGQLVLLGDNPDGSGDSRLYGYVPTDAVVGVVLRPLHGQAPAVPVKPEPRADPVRVPCPDERHVAHRPVDRGER
ncbi:hypothetical protein GCM10022225_06180 [Plantactinospora mayteni]|uniref:Peptidase S26 domain-containing protein n=1 Tax=Plantactinospora mayteni TaxID=566021 RepID=A0ABQ4ER31_9ACTN|nr:hypothetical protein Pma05_36810 [Plantactinospora mayteni]